MKRETAYKIAIEAIKDKRQHVAFDHCLASAYAAAKNKRASKHYERFTQAIEILEAERDHKQMSFLY
jgi:hypothetical protein